MQQLYAQFIALGLLDWIGITFGLLQVVLAMYNNKLNFVAGIISVVAFVLLFANAGLFAEAALNVYYFTISIYGLLRWNPATTKVVIATSNNKNWSIAIVIFIICFSATYFVLKQYTTSTVPLADSLIAAFAWSGTYLLAEHKIENWILLNISNAIAIPIQYNKGLHAVSIFTAILFIVAIFGWYKWRKIFKEQATTFAKLN